MTPKRRPRSRKQTEQSLEEAREAARKAAEMGEPIELDPASELFFEFAAPLLVNARSDQEFAAATAIAEFVWAASHFDAATQARLTSEFIAESGIPADMIPWFLDVFAELVERKEALVG